MAYPVNPTEFPTTPTGTVNAAERLRFATFGFTAERSGGTTPVTPSVGVLSLVTKGAAGTA